MLVPALHVHYIMHICAYISIAIFQIVSLHEQMYCCTFATCSRHWNVLWTTFFLSLFRFYFFSAIDFRIISMLFPTRNSIMTDIGMHFHCNNIVKYVSMQRCTLTSWEYGVAILIGHSPQFFHISLSFLTHILNKCNCIFTKNFSLCHLKTNYLNFSGPMYSLCEWGEKVHSVFSTAVVTFKPENEWWKLCDSFKQRSKLFAQWQVFAWFKVKLDRFGIANIESMILIFRLKLASDCFYRALSLFLSNTHIQIGKTN